MHGPARHCIVSAPLLAVAAKHSEFSADIPEKKPHAALQRMERIGCGTFASAWPEANPYQEQYRDTLNFFASICMAHVASVAVRAAASGHPPLHRKAARLVPELPGVDMGSVPKPKCRRSAQQRVPARNLPVLS